MGEPEVPLQWLEPSALPPEGSTSKDQPEQTFVRHTNLIYVFFLFLSFFLSFLSLFHLELFPFKFSTAAAAGSGASAAGGPLRRALGSAHARVEPCAGFLTPHMSGWGPCAGLLAPRWSEWGP